MSSFAFGSGNASRTYVKPFLHQEYPNPRCNVVRQRRIITPLWTAILHEF
jgi:hypothetical protein